VPDTAKNAVAGFNNQRVSLDFKSETEFEFKSAQGTTMVETFFGGTYYKVSP
jgi:hypothetical protein